MNFFKDEIKRNILFLVVSGIFLVLDFMGAGFSAFRPAWIAVILCGAPIIKEALEELVLHGNIKAGLLVTMAIIASIFTGEIFAAGEVSAIMVLGELLEDITSDKAKAGVEALAKAAPNRARILADGGEKMIPADDVRVGDIVRVLPGEMIPVDGEIVSGKTAVDQSSVTGESIPVDKIEGDRVFSGTVNQLGAFDFKALKTGENSSFQRMVRLVEEADASKAKIVGTADKWAFWVVIIALASALIAYFVTRDAKRAVTVLVVFCPCALVVATPAAIMAGIGNAAKRGILVKSGDALERLAGVKKIAFDKTGTITYGKAVLSGFTTAEGVDREKFMEYAASAEAKSEHPLGEAVVRCHRENGGRFLETAEFSALPGTGIRAMVEGREIHVLNNADYAGILDENEILARKENGEAVGFVTVDGKLQGALFMSDEIREDAQNVVESVESMGAGCMLMTGDNKSAARYMAQKAGIKEVYSECLPEEKMRIIGDYQEKGVDVCMIGDGINDAPSLKSACVGVAMGIGGSDIALEAADIALVKDNISDIPHLLGLSKRTMKTINRNIAISMTLNFAGLALAFAGLLNPAGGAIVHNAGSVFVVLNSAFLLRYGVKQG